MKRIPPKILRTWLSYDPTSGAFRWLLRPTRKLRAGDIAGSVNSDGYIVIGFRGTDYFAHKLAYWFVHGVWPSSIDHRNGRRDDNRIKNLRPADRSQNARNRRASGKTSIYKGVYLTEGRYRARIFANGRRTSLGSFSTEAAAARAYDDAARQYFGEFAALNFEGEHVE